MLSQIKENFRHQTATCFGWNNHSGKRRISANKKGTGVPFCCFTTGSRIIWRPVPQNVFWSGQHDHLRPELFAYQCRTGGKLSKRPSGCLCTELNLFWMHYRKYRLQWFLCIPGGYLVSWLTSLGRIAIWSVLLSNTIRISVKLGRVA